MKNTYRLTDKASGATVLVTIEAVAAENETAKDIVSMSALYSTVASDIVENAEDLGLDIVAE